MSAVRIHCMLAAVFASASLGSATAQYAATQRLNLGPLGVEANYPSIPGRMSPDGRFVTFTSRATNLLPVPSNQGHLYVLDRRTLQLEIVNQSSAGVIAHGDPSLIPNSISADGRFIGFDSKSDDLVAGDTNNAMDAFVRDRQLGTTTRVSVNAAGTQGNANSSRAWVADDGRSVAFVSFADNLVPGDTNGENDLFLKDLVTGQVRRITLSTTGGQADGDVLSLSASGDLQWVAYLDGATNLVNGDTNSIDDVFATNTLTGVTLRVNVSSTGDEADDLSSYPEISRDGSVVAFVSKALTLAPDDTNGVADVFVHEIATGLTERVSLGNGGTQLNGWSLAPQLSADGRFVAFGTIATHILPAVDHNGGIDSYVFDRIARRVTCATLGWNGTFVAAGALPHAHMVTSISGDGRYVLFGSEGANIVQNDFNHYGDVFLRDWLASTGPVVFCPSAASSGGCAPQISASANPSATSANACQISVAQLDAQRNGLFFYGIDNSNFAAHTWLGGPSWLCVQAPFQRTPLQDSGGTPGSCSGSFQLDWNQFQQTHPGALGNPWVLGQRIYTQAWYRDPSSTATTALSNALELVAQP